LLNLFSIFIHIKINMKLIQEFKEFAVKGNMIDMAIGIIIGASFNKVIDVLVKKVLLPPLSLLSDGINLESKKIILRESQTNSEGEFLIEEVAIRYGQFVETFLDFLIVGFTIFMVVKFINRLNKKAEDPTDKSISTPKNIQLLMDMNSLLEEQNRILKEKK
jgi:large conductance mechanosensitive channel